METSLGYIAIPLICFVKVSHTSNMVKTTGNTHHYDVSIFTATIDFLIFTVNIHSSLYRVSQNNGHSFLWLIYEFLAARVNVTRSSTAYGKCRAPVRLQGGPVRYTLTPAPPSYKRSYNFAPMKILILLYEP